MQTSPLYELGANESPLGPSPKVIEAIGRAARLLNRYPPRGDECVRDALAQHHGRGLNREHFFTACGGSESIELIARTLLQPDDEIVICSPTFRAYGVFARLCRARVVDVPLDRTTFAHRIEAIVEAVTPRTRFVVICNPNNPAGVVMPESDQTALLGALPEHVETLVDEAYVDFVTRFDFPDSIGSVLEGRRVIVVRTFSKAYGLAGLRLGYGLARPELCQRISSYRRPFHLSQLHVEAALAALDDQDHVRRVVALARSGKDYICAELDRLHLKYWPSDANFVMIEPPTPADRIEEALRHRGIAVHPTESNGLRGCLRVTIGLPEANHAFVAALEQALGA